MKQVNSKIILCGLIATMFGLAFLLMMFGMAFFQQWKSGSQDMFYAPDSAAKHVAALKRIIFSDKPALKTELDPIIFLFNSHEDKLSAHLRLKYDLPGNFRYSPIGVLLQCNKDLFALLTKKHQLMISYKYGKYPVEEIYVDYVTVTPESSWHGTKFSRIVCSSFLKSTP